jgi:hypothetical protein
MHDGFLQKILGTLIKLPRSIVKKYSRQKCKINRDIMMKKRMKKIKLGRHNLLDFPCS